MSSKIYCSNVLLAGASVVMLVFVLQVTSAFDANEADQLQSHLEKRIFCNFDGCHNKRSGDTSLRKMFDRLMAEKSGIGAATGSNVDVISPENLLPSHRGLFATEWDNAAQSDDVNDVSRQDALWRVVKQRLRSNGYNIRRRRSILQ